MWPIMCWGLIPFVVCMCAEVSLIAIDNQSIHTRKEKITHKDLHSSANSPISAEKKLDFYSASRGSKNSDTHGRESSYISNSLKVSRFTNYIIHSYFFIPQERPVQLPKYP